MEKNISFTLKVWRQKGPKAKGAFETYQMKDIPGDTSFLEMLDILNEDLINEGKEPIVFDHDCREGICGMCSLYINGHPHGPATGATTCQMYMRRFEDGDTITVEPWRSAGFPVIRDLMVDRTAFDKIMQAGGYVNINTGAPQDANAIKKFDLLGHGESDNFVHSNFDYEKGCFTTIDGYAKGAPTSDAILWYRYNYVLIGKPKRVLIFKINKSDL